MRQHPSRLEWKRSFSLNLGQRGAGVASGPIYSPRGVRSGSAGGDHRAL